MNAVDRRLVEEVACLWTRQGGDADGFAILQTEMLKAIQNEIDKRAEIVTDLEAERNKP